MMNYKTTLPRRSRVTVRSFVRRREIQSIERAARHKRAVKTAKRVFFPPVLCIVVVGVLLKATRLCPNYFHTCLLRHSVFLFRLFGAELNLKLLGNLVKLCLVKRVKVRMLESVRGVDTLRRIVDEQLAQKIDTVLIELRDNLGEILRLPLRELVPVAQVGDARPHLLVWRTKELENVKELLKLGIAREERLLASELGKHASDAPHVHRGGVVGSTEQNFGRAVPEGDNFVRVTLHRHAKGSAETQIRNLE